MRRRAMGLLGLLGLLDGCGASRGEVPIGATRAPAVWVEAEPTRAPNDRVDTSAWSGEWVEYFAGRPICQDRFIVRAVGSSFFVQSIDCTKDQPYSIRDIRWDGRTLRFTAEAPGGGPELKYEVRLDGPGQIAGEVNGRAITWSRTSRPGRTESKYEHVH